MHRWLADKLHAARTERGRNINVVGPRGGAKSTVGTLANILRCAVEGTEPYIWILSESGEQASQFLEDIKRELIDNERLALDYPEACGKGSPWRSNAIRLRNNVIIQAHGRGKKIRGRKNRQDRPTLIVCDDLQSETVMISGDQRDKDWNWFNGTVMKAGDHRTNVVNLATAYHREAIGLRLSRTGGWRSKTFSAICEWPADMSLWEQWAEIYHDLDLPDSQRSAREFYELHRSDMDRGASLLWPDREPLYYLMAIREADRSTFEREKQSRPINPEDCEWSETLFDDRIWFTDWPQSWQCKTLALDPSKGRDARRSDFSAYVSLMVGVDGVLYVDANLKRRSTDDMVADGVAICREWRPDVFGVEANAWQELLATVFEGEFVRQGLLAAAPWTIDNRIAKAVRIRRIGPYLSQRRIKFKRNSEGATLLIAQMRDFPDPHAHDDGPDALEMAIRLAYDVLNKDRSQGVTAADVLRQRGFV